MSDASAFAVARLMTRCDRIVGGASRDRTDDLRVANATLSQLSYGPLSIGRKRRDRASRPSQRTSHWVARLHSRWYPRATDMVGLGGVEPPTSPLSGVRSNQLSYRPGGQRRVVPPRVLTNQLNIRTGNL